MRRLPIKSLRSILHCSAAILFFFTCPYCKSRSAAWREALQRQMSREKNLAGLDSGLYNFMISYHVPAISISVGRNNNIIYSRSFGLANLSREEEVSPLTIFRIAGISGVVTSLAISKLVEDGKISYNSKVFGDSGILGTKYGHTPYPPQISQITIANLLLHESGAWSDTTDPLAHIEIRTSLSSRDSAIDWIIEHAIGKELPGKSFSISYTNYYILAAVIEKLTGTTYENWTKANILQPAGIRDMQVENEKSGPKIQATNYRDLSWPFYNGDIDEDLRLSKADGALGWLASSRDLVLLMQQYNLPDTVVATKDRLLFGVPSTRDRNFVPDWTYIKQDGNWWMQFIYFGSTAIIVKSSNGYYWSILMNTYRPTENEFFNDIDSLIKRGLVDSSFIGKQVVKPGQK